MNRGVKKEVLHRMESENWLFYKPELPISQDK